MLTEARHESRDPLSLVLGAIAAQVTGGLVTQLSPFVISGLIHDFALSEREAGFIASIEFITLAVTAIAVAPILPRLSCRRLGLVAVALTSFGQIASTGSASSVSFALLRGLAGIGEGALFAVSLCVVARRSSNPDRVYGYFQVVWALGSVALFSVAGELTAAFGLRGILALMAGVTVALAPLLLLVPEGRSAENDGARAEPARGSPLLGVMTLAAIVLYLTVSAAVYMFSAPLGERAGLDTRSIGYALTVASLVGIAGAGAAAALHVRWGRAIPITGFCIAFALSALVLCIAREPTSYVIALVASVVIYYFSIPYLFGLAAAIDPSGRWAAAAGSAYLLGFAAGPVVAGAAIAGIGYAGFAAACVAITAGAWGLAMVVNRRVSAQAPLPQAALPQAALPRAGLARDALPRDALPRDASPRSPSAGA
jgi:predicted MFS family arabinose efflux permease